MQSPLTSKNNGRHMPRKLTATQYQCRCRERERESGKGKIYVHLPRNRKGTWLHFTILFICGLLKFSECIVSRVNTWIGDESEWTERICFEHKFIKNYLIISTHKVNKKPQKMLRANAVTNRTLLRKQCSQIAAVFFFSDKWINPN